VARPLRPRSAAIENFAAATADRLVRDCDPPRPAVEKWVRSPASHSTGRLPTSRTDLNRPVRTHRSATEPPLYLHRTSHRGQVALYCSGRVRKVA